MTTEWIILLLTTIAACVAVVDGFASPSSSFASHRRRSVVFHPSLHLRNSPTVGVGGPTMDGTVSPSESDVEEEEERRRVGNLVADEEWAGLSMELAEIIRTAVVEDLKKNSRDFLGKDEYLLGDFSKEIDSRVKAEVAKIREKDEYELGDLSVVLDDKVKELVCKLSGKDEYEFGDLSVQIDIRSKKLVAEFCGKEDYEFGDLSRELARRTREGVLNYTGKSDYKFGDLTKQALKNLSGKEDYQVCVFGDVTKKFLGNVFKKDKK
ncbi:hypothetical protein ACHAXA_000058 [Cyclostephanos tholiformis]|uniref:Uncharacterized protein n=1 Tax=Cyclostephanos tholiformis TaxID=382380 RepID=A0ABD3SQX3_9STRA